MGCCMVWVGGYLMCIMFCVCVRIGCIMLVSRFSVRINNSLCWCLVSGVVVVVGWVGWCVLCVNCVDMESFFIKSLVKFSYVCVSFKCGNVG